MMAIKFEKNGNLDSNYQLSYEQFKKEFGFNESRKGKLKRVLLFLKIFQSLGCTDVYIVGSFVSKKDFPNDIDVCIDITNIDLINFTKDYPEFLQSKGIDKIKQEHGVHFAAFFDFGSRDILDWFRKDRDNNPRGLVKINLDDIHSYD
jgi:predicted nucleotidyltransferase